MGWFALAVFVASASYLLYKHPPSSWDLSASKSRALNEEQEQPPNGTSQQPGKSIGEDIIHGKHTILVNENGISNKPDNSGSESAQATPKAVPVAAPTLNIPSFALDDDPVDSIKEPLSTSTGNPQPTSTPSVSSPELSTPKSMPGMKENETPAMAPPPRPPTLSNQQTSSSNRSSLMPPPPRPSANVPLRPPPSSASSLRVPPSATTSSSLSSSTLSPLSGSGKPKSSRQVTLEPGYSPLDWAALTSDPRANLRGANLPPNLIRVTPSMLRAQNGRKGRDAWTSYMGKVYNITPYLPFHPGGKGEILRGAGKDSAKLFTEVHPWVNWDGMLGECLVGILVGENDPAAGGSQLDEMD